MSHPQEVLLFVRCRLGGGAAPEDVCESLINRCLAPDCQMGGLGCDNMTVAIVCCLAGGNWQQVWYSGTRGSAVSRIWWRKYCSKLLCFFRVLLECEF